MEQNSSIALYPGYLLKGNSYVYQIEKVLGQGTFGITYLAKTKVKVFGTLGEIETTIPVAVKEFFMKDVNGRSETTVTCSSQGDLYEDYKRKFAREADNLSKLKHPHIVKVLELFECNNTFYYSMEYCEGGSLDDLIVKSKGLKVDVALSYFRQIGDALSFMHNHHMLHLDLKPGNVMLRSNGDVVLIDFGLSKQYSVTGEPESSTRVGSGTPGYAPIEQSNYQDGKDFPVTMDIYALGATLYKMLTGIRPPEASGILNDGFPVFDLQKKGIPGDLISCIAVSMSPMRKNRYQSVSDFMLSLSQDLGLSCLEEFGIENTIYDNLVHGNAQIDTNITETIEKPKSIKNNISGHEYVDLGLPSGLKWATHNLGAGYPEDFGSYYTWKEVCSKNAHLDRDREIGLNFSGEEIHSNFKYDIVREKWGGSWRLPTKGELEELVDKCQWMWINKNGCNGYEIIGPNENSIFLPASGCRFLSANYNVGENGRYWSSTPDESKASGLFRLNFLKEYYSVYWQGDSYGLNIRPVSD